jgi:hypothetical protein
MCRNLDLRFLLFYCLLSKFFFVPFSFFCLVFYYFFSFCRIDFCFYRPSFLTLFYSFLVYPNLFETKRLGCWLVDARYVLIMTKQYSLHFEIVCHSDNKFSFATIISEEWVLFSINGDKNYSVLKHFNGTNSALYSGAQFAK